MKSNGIKLALLGFQKLGLTGQGESDDGLLIYLGQERTHQSRGVYRGEWTQFASKLGSGGRELHPEGGKIPPDIWVIRKK